MHVQSVGKRQTYVGVLSTRRAPADTSNMKEGANKRMGITKLPPVLSFQFKRFEQGPTSVRKISTAVRIPSRINMAPYTHLAQAARDPEPGSFLTHPGPEGMYEYDLFAIVNHEGDLNTGHYTNFARFEDEVRRSSVCTNDVD